MPLPADMADAQQAQQQQRDAVVAQVAAALSAGAAATVMLPDILAALASLSVTAQAGRAAFALVTRTPAAAGVVGGTASRQTAVAERTYRAAYLVAAADRIQRRLAAGDSLATAVAAERPYFAQHRQAAANRRQVAGQVDAQAASHGTLLGWYAQMDARTSAECAAANGSNFSVTARPVIGWPGSVHPHCRCRAGAPHAGAGLVGATTSTQERKAAVA